MNYTKATRLGTMAPIPSIVFVLLMLPISGSQLYQPNVTAMMQDDKLRLECSTPYTLNRDHGLQLMWADPLTNLTVMPVVDGHTLVNRTLREHLGSVACCIALNGVCVEPPTTPTALPDALVRYTFTASMVIRGMTQYVPVPCPREDGYSYRWSAAPPRWSHGSLQSHKQLYSDYRTETAIGSGTQCYHMSTTGDMTVDVTCFTDTVFICRGYNFNGDMRHVHMHWIHSHGKVHRQNYVTCGHTEFDCEVSCAALADAQVPMVKYDNEWHVGNYGVGHMKGPDYLSCGYRNSIDSAYITVDGGTVCNFTTMLHLVVGRGCVQDTGSCKYTCVANGSNCPGNEHYVTEIYINSTLATVTLDRDDNYTVSMYMVDVRPPGVHVVCEYGGFQHTMFVASPNIMATVSPGPPAPTDRDDDRWTVPTGPGTPGNDQHEQCVRRCELCMTAALADCTAECHECGGMPPLRESWHCTCMCDKPQTTECCRVTCGLDDNPYVMQTEDCGCRVYNATWVDSTCCSASFGHSSSRR
ncbi:hypothetical protein [Banggai cardinalfish iridovirus]|uniref:Uncharacterized protein n=2 Tax=Infectious spleen and kidney necrosis virus TaxID=180170 RepID=A0A6M3QS66_ISKNV|nr:hypothetical protein [Banggai cardinalfish iridovirus]QYK20540.1 009R [Spotted knifejaw iridovirus]UWH18797.1 ORF009 [Infectious spleen and kidney necrosis virus]WEP24547.1 hypothetical protein ORF008R [Largemouth bass ulcerative syndrome virus]